MHTVCKDGRNNTKSNDEKGGKQAEKARSIIEN